METTKLNRREFLKRSHLYTLGAYVTVKSISEASADQVRDRVFNFLHERESIPLTEKIAVPEGHSRVSVQRGSFSEWMRQLPLKRVNNGIFDEKGKKIFSSEMAHSIVDLDVWKYQECADAAMRLWAEYLASKGKLNRLNLKLENGQPNPQPRPHDRRSLRKYLNYQFAFASSWTLKRDLKKISTENALPGDVIVLRQPRTPQGHVFVILDVVEDREGKRKVVIGQSNIPAQSFHIVNNPVPFQGWGNYHDEFTKTFSVRDLVGNTIGDLFGAQKKSDNTAWFDLEKFMDHTKYDANGQGVIRRFR